MIRRSIASRRNWLLPLLFSCLIDLTGCGFFRLAEDGRIEVDPRDRYCVSAKEGSPFGSIATSTMKLNPGESGSLALGVESSPDEGCTPLPSPKWEITRTPDPAIATASISGNTLAVVASSDPRVNRVLNFYTGPSLVGTTSVTVSLANLPAGSRPASTKIEITVSIKFAGTINVDDEDETSAGVIVTPASMPFSRVRLSRVSAIPAYIQAYGPTYPVEITVSGPDASSFSASSGGGRVGPGKGLFFEVVFRPQTEGSKSATLIVTANPDFAIPRVITVALSGTGVP